MDNNFFDIHDFEKSINYKFKNIELLSGAFCHSSYVNENLKSNRESNERLEFLGDAVLELVISDHIFKEYSNLPEGELTKFRASIVCEATLAAKARQLKIGNYLMLGKGERTTGGNERDSILADTFEAVLGAIYLDSGFDIAKQHILEIMLPSIKELEHNFKMMDYKTYLQEYMQKISKETVKYNIIKEYGPAHDKNFLAEAVHSGKKLGEGIGKTKKEAEQNAALDSLNKLN